jgi:hypothetical protein
MNSGNIELISNRISTVQLAIQTIANGGTSEIIQMFIKSENEGLRRRLYNIESDHKLGKMTAEQFNSQRLDILKLLEKLKEPLSPQEVEFLRKVQITFHFLSFSSSDYCVYRVIRIYLIIILLPMKSVSCHTIL